MISVRMHPRESWEAALRACGCRPCEGLGRLNTAEWWVSNWGFLFTVPIEGPDDRVGERELGEILDMINKSKPN